MKKILGFFFILVLLLLAAIILIPILFKGKILELAKTTINEEINAKVDFDDVNLSLIKSFPDFSICLDNYKVEGLNDFEKILLAKGDEACIKANFWSVIKPEDGLKINGVHLSEPVINIVINKNGKANYDIMKDSGTEETSDSSSPSYELNLKKYTIENGSFSYFDKSSQLFMHADAIQHEGSGNFKETIYDLITDTKLKNLTFSSGGINYINKAAMHLDAIFNIDLDQSKYTLKDNQLVLNALKINTDGYVQTKGDDILMDLKFKSPSTSLKELISLVPGAYTKDYNNVKADGQVAFDGYVKGTYNESKMPSFEFDVQAANGNLQYPGMPLGIKDINTSFNLKSPGANLDDMVLNMPNFKLKIGENPLQGKLILKTILTDPNIDTEMKGLLNLSEFAQAFPIEGVKELTGTINSDFKIKSSLSELESGKYDNIDMSGSLDVKNLNYVSTDMPKVVVNSLTVDFLPQFLKINEFDALLGKSDLKASGKIDNFLAWFAPEKTMKGDLMMSSTLFNVNEWMSEEETNETEPVNATTTEEVFDRFNFNLDAKIGTLVYDSYKFKNFATKGNFTPNSMEIDLFKTNIGRSDIEGRGEIKNTFAYLFDNQMLTGNISLSSGVLDLNEFMEEDNGSNAKKISGEENLDPFLVPENVDIDVTADLGKVIYTDMELTNVKGKLEIADQQIQMKGVKGNTLGGSMKIDGGYNTQDEEKPTFDVKYNLSKMDFSKAFEKFNTFKFIMPIGKYIDGKFSTDMSFNGILGKDMMPDINTLTADGFMQTFDAVVKNFKPLEEIGKKLNISYFKNLSLENSKNWFTVADGKVVMKESKQSVKNIDMLISGSHGFDQAMDYKIKAKIPRNLLGKGTAGNIANKGLDFLNKEASKLGVKITDGEFINVLVNLTGSITKPNVKITPLGSEGESVKDITKNVIAAVKDTVTQVVKAKVDDGKERVAAEKAKLEAEAERKIAAIKKNAEKQIQKVEREAKKRADDAKALAYKEADKLEDKAGNNPLKKLAAKKAVELAKKEADKVHRNSLNRVSGQTDKIRARADKEAEKIRATYDTRVKDLEKKAGM